MLVAVKEIAMSKLFWIAEIGKNSSTPRKATKRRLHERTFSDKLALQEKAAWKMRIEEANTIDAEMEMSMLYDTLIIFTPQGVVRSE